MGDTTTEALTPAQIEAIDGYLSECVRSWLRASSLPNWPTELERCQIETFDRVGFHGITLLLWEANPDAAGWPAAISEAMRAQATAQSFWELGHRAILADLLEAFDETGIEAVITKGTALAYSLYPDPAARRRGDTDILVAETCKTRARLVLSDCGFQRSGDELMLQEMWHRESDGGFDHFIDLHWRPTSSPAISRHLERADLATNTLPIPSLSSHARGVSLSDNLVLVSINRSLHLLHGYMSGDVKLRHGDRLIWAADIDLICNAMAEADWLALASTTRLSGSSHAVLSAMEFAHRTLGTRLPKDKVDAIAANSQATGLENYLTTTSSLERRMMDITATKGLSNKARLIKAAIAPSSDKLRERFPDHTGWPVAALRARRLFEVIVSLFRGRT